MADFVVEFGKDGGKLNPDGRLDAAAFHRNHTAIWGILADFLRHSCGDVVEVGSGTGQHVTYFAEQSPAITWWPSDLNPAHLTSIDAWRTYTQRRNVRPPLRIDLSDPFWCPEMRDGRGPKDLRAVFCANVVHIAPWSVAEGLIQGAAHYLSKDGKLFVYGPFQRNGVHTAESNAAFDASLRQRDPAWGVRDVEALDAVAQANGLFLHAIHAMPANNLILEFSRAVA